MEMTDMEGNLVYVLGRQDPIISVTASRNISNFNIDKKEPSFSVEVEKGLCSITVGSSCTPLVYAVNRGVVGPRGERGLPGIKETITSEQIDLLF